MRRREAQNPRLLSHQPANYCLFNYGNSSSLFVDKATSVAKSCGVPEDVVTQLLEERSTGTYKKGSVIFMQDSPGDVLFWVLSGLVRITCRVKGRDRVTVDLAGRGDLFGFAFLLDDAERRAQAFEAYAVTDCKVALLTHERVIKALETLEPTVLVRVIGHLTSAWSKALRARVRRLGLDFREQLLEVLADLSARFGVREARGVMLIPELHHRDFAEMIGCSRPAATKIVEEMVAAGVLARSGKRYIVLGHDDPTGSGRGLPPRAAPLRQTGNLPFRSRKRAGA